MNTNKMCFVFGSNLRGVHGAGAAAYAHKELGAQWGVGEGPTGDCYALPTKDIRIESLPIGMVAVHVSRFLQYALSHPELKFKVTQIGCGLAGFKPEQIAPMFKNAPDNCYYDIGWMDYLPEGKHYWN